MWNMTLVRILALVVTAGMSVAIVFGLIEGDFSAEGSQIWALAWGRVSLVDLYLGLAIFGGWVAVRERRPFPTMLWWIALVLLGNFAAGVYLITASFRSRDIRQLLLGRAVNS